MICLKGQGASGGVVEGPLHFLKLREETPLPESGIGSEAEKARFFNAQRNAVIQMNGLAERCRKETGEEAALLFETHAMMAEDEDFAAEVAAQMNA